MADKIFPKSGLPIRRTVELLPTVFQTETNDKFLSGVLDPLVQPGVLDKIVGYVGRRYGKTFNGNDIYLDTDQTLRSRYQLEPAVVYKNHGEVENFYDYLDFKNQIKFFGNSNDRDDKITDQRHYTWNPPIDWDKFINYREYYWEPSGPPSVPVFGQSISITSTYKVNLGPTNNSFIFTPDSVTNNPTITLYRGQTYKFRVNAPNEGFVIRTNYDTGSLIYKPFKAYFAGEQAVFNDKLWRAKVNISAGDGSSIDADSQDWEFIEDISSGTALDYNKGVTNNRTENGTLTFEVPYDAPDVLFYQGIINPDRFGRFIIADIESNTSINVDLEILGKTTYKSSNDIEFTNGLVIEFRGNVTPSKYSRDTWLVEGVGTAITLTRFTDLIVPILTTDVPEVLFDNEGFDTQPFDDAAAFPTYKDYITISKNSIDNNSWSRYNRWFHRSVLEYAYRSRGQDFPAEETARAKRPIIEFKSNLQLFNHGSVAKQSVDYIDTFTKDVFSDIEGSSGYNVDGEFLFEGARVLVIADTDNLVNNKIYEVEFILHNNSRQIHLKEIEDSESILGQCVLIKRGKNLGGKMFHYNGTSWVPSQEKTAVNQPPLFDVFDSDGVSFGDEDTYPISSFIGSKILSYKAGNGRIDRELGFSLSYLNIDNVGDIQFQWDWDTETFEYIVDQKTLTKKISVGFYKINPNDQFLNGWSHLDNSFIQAIVDSLIVESETNTVVFNTINWTNVKDSDVKINFYLNGKRLFSNWTRSRNQFVFDETFKSKDVLSIKIIGDIEPDQGYYEIPAGLEKNPLNDILDTFTLGQAVDHVMTAVEFDEEINGNVPGSSNLRDISNYQQYAKRFLKHSGLAPLSIAMLCDKTHNIIKSLQYAKKSYTDFKNNFLKRATEISFNDNIKDFVDDIISDLTRTKNSNSPFSDSDMIGSGAYTPIIYNVDDAAIKTFSLSQRFNLTEPSRRAVYVYLNDSQLLNQQDYEFNSTFGFVTINVDIQEGDVIEIREYVSTAFNHIPPTPSSIGLYKKYTPKKFLDDTYVEPREVIQGHDGSITTIYGDFRDDLLLELELRIYNNIKRQYDPEIFNIDNTVGGYYYKGDYNRDQLNEIIIQDYLKWVQNTNINYTLNSYLDTENSFTYTYSNMTDPTRTQNLPGYWRGVYRWFYDTDRPHRCPWEMLGFSEQPDWWESQYGPAPYTSGNLILWEDLSEGIIRQGPRAGIHDRYKRNTLLSHIPVDGDGNLLSPLDSGLAQDYSLINNKGPFVLGDISPAEYAWRASSEYPFSIITAMCLLKPFDFITENLDLFKTKVNLIGQTVYQETDLFVTLNDINVPTETDEVSSGLIKYLVSYIKSRGVDQNTIQDKISNLDVALSHRLSGFVDQNQQKYLLDSKNPSSTTSSIFVPPENYDIIFNVSSPISSVTYSGVILEKTNNGWLVTGYDDLQPYFNYYAPVPNQRDPIISVGGVSENFLDWTENRVYNNGTLVRYSNDFYRALRTHNSGLTFDNTQWQKLPGIPKVGAVEALRRRNFNEISVKRLSYGSLLTTVQSVVDFLLGYEKYLKNSGFVFDRYDPENRVSQDWTSSAKEFMFWTKHNWAVGSLITLSPSAQKINVTVPVGVADNILDGFYDYQILKSDGKPLTPNFINVNRSFQNITIETVNTTEGLFFVKIYYVLKEHVAVFDDRTVFNDVIYDKTTGYRQERIKTQGFRTVDWDGDYTSPGFLFDNVNIEIWQPFRDYKLGDIVAYRSFNWVSLSNQLGTKDFDDSKWSKLDTTPRKQLISNFDYKIKEFSDFYEVSSEGIGESQRQLARHSIGYQSRNYLQNLSEDSVTQFQLYQGFIREKGTSNSIIKVFGKLSRAGTESIDLNEEWAVRIGKFGGTDQIQEIEIQLEKNKFELNPQPILIQTSESFDLDQYYRITGADFTVSLIPYSPDINPVSLEQEPTLTAGYVFPSSVEHILSNKDALLNYDINNVKENDHIWLTFQSPNWTVVRVNESPLLYIIDYQRNSDTSIVLELNRPHQLLSDDVVGFRDIENLTGFFKIISTTANSITLEIDQESLDPEIDVSTRNYLQLLTDCRLRKGNDYFTPENEQQSYDLANQRDAALLKNNSRLFVDDNGNGLWEIIQKKKQFQSKQILDYGISTPLRTGEKVIYDNINKQIIVGMPGSGYVMCYSETESGLRLKQIVSPPVGLQSRIFGSFGSRMALSPDGKFLIVCSPEATDVPSEFRGDWTNQESYGINDVVLYGGKLYRAVSSVIPDLSTELAVNTDDWEIADYIGAYSTARGHGYAQQGMITVYEFSNERWQVQETFVSPRPADYEKFGSEITIGLDNGIYYMAVSAIGAQNNTGRVYLYSNNGSGWKHLENTAFKGIYDPSVSYKEGEIVYQASPELIGSVRGELWMSVDDSTETDGSTITLESSSWIKVSNISTNCSLPTNVSVEDDGSTLDLGLLSATQLAELVSQGDQFGTSLAMNKDASILIVGSPNSDGQYFSNYRGIWRPDIEYVEGEVVRYKDLSTDDPYTYYRLEDAELGPDSTLRSYNERPDESSNWVEVGDSTSDPSGKIFVYQRTSYGSYELKQMINAGSLASFSDAESGLIITTGDQFGFAMDIDFNGDTLVVSSPRTDINFQDQGSAYVFERDARAPNLEFRLKQKLESFEIYPNEYFGYSVSISPDRSTIVVGARNTPTSLPIFFDLLSETTFDNGRTSFSSTQGYTGAAYVYEKKDQTYFLTEKLEDTFSPNESFGYSVDCLGSTIVVGSPDFRLAQPHQLVISYEGPFIGNVRLFKKNPNVSSWEILAEQQPVVDLRKIKSIELYDDVRNLKLQDLDYIDPAKGKILNLAEREIKFKTSYDPAVYTIGTDGQVVDLTINWLEKNVGALWWDLSTAKWLHYEQNDVAYRIGNWNSLSVGGSINVYEWVETPLLPSEWAAVADTNEGIAEGISGQPLYPNDDVYSFKEFFNESTGQVSGTLYYYWVKNKNVVPKNMPSRTRSAAEVASLISNPAGSGIAFVSLIDKDKILAYNFRSIINSDTALINIQYYKTLENQVPVHNEYQLLTEGVADSLPTVSLEEKWIDSLVGFDKIGNRVPDIRLPAKQRYGVLFRPRQGMFVDRLPILKTVVDNINSVLKKEAFADSINFEYLNLVDNIPESVLNLYDIEVDTYPDLLAVGTVRIRQAVLRANLVDGQLDTVEIVDSGFGYRTTPNVEIEGDGLGARIELTIDNQGRIATATVVSRGKKYSTLIPKVRNFSVLVKSDRTINNFWSIYAWDNIRQVFFRSRSQAFDTTRYWSLVDWWKDGYGITSRIVREISTVTEEEALFLTEGDLLRIKEFSSGGWAVFEKVNSFGETFLDRYVLVGREKGTIKFDSSLWDTTIFGIGYDNTQAFDNTYYDIQNSAELRNILKAVKENIFINDYEVEWNKLFFTCIRYILEEQQYVDWVFKTSFLNATHNVGPFEQKLNYKSDSLESYQTYINEVKPFRTTVREYVSRYDTLEPYGSAIADFDLPATYSVNDGAVVPITNGRAELQQYPWKWWTDNNGYSIIEIEVYDSGENYTTPPKVLIEGNGTGCVAQAYVSNGRVSGVVVLSQGTGYTSSPRVTLVGGNPAGSRQAKATAILGNSKVRSFDLTVKFDRINKDGIYQQFSQTQNFVASGLTGVFNLNYAPTRDKTKISILKNNQIVLDNEYTVNLYYSSSDSYSLIRGRIVFNRPPVAGDQISVVYEKNDVLLDAVNRIQRYYNPAVGMKGSDLSQLMTGIDFGGVQIQGTTFEVTGGWDALPWFTDNWDSVESSSDYYYIVEVNNKADSSTVYDAGATIDFQGTLYTAIKRTLDPITGDVVLPLTDGWEEYWQLFSVSLPYVPEQGQQITVYLRRSGEGTSRVIDTLGPDTAPNVVLTESTSGPSTIRIDDPNYNENWDSSYATNPNAQMPTFVGDGSTRTVEIAKYLEVRNGDTLIFRPIESDGSVTITDPNLLDTRLSGGSLSAMNDAYVTATGLTAEEIVITGGKFIEPDHVPAPEENVPGQVLDSVSIRVYNNTPTGAAPLQSKIIFGDSVATTFDIGQNVLESNSVIVYVDKIKKVLGTDYTLDIENNTVIFNSAPPLNSIVEILSIGIGGLELLDYQEFIADGETALFLTNANFDDTSSIFVTLNGEYVDTGFRNSTDVIDAVGKTLIEFAQIPVAGDVIKIVCMKAALDVDSSGLAIVRINKQTIEFEGSTRSFDLDNFVNLSRSSALSAIIVELNGTVLRGVDSTYAIYDGTNRTFVLGTDPEESAGTILPSNIKVYVNDRLLTFIQDYLFDGPTKVLIIEPRVLTIGDSIRIENDLRAQYFVQGNNLVIDSSVTLTSVDETDNDKIEVTWFSEYPTMDIVSDEFTGGKVQYKLSTLPLTASYVWVYKNGTRLTQDEEYYLSLPRGVVYLADPTETTDLIKIITFGSVVYKLPSAYEIHKDMLNFYHYKRFSKGTVKLAKRLNYYDTSIEVTDGNQLTDPIRSRNIPGIIYINGERIEYLNKQGNVLTQLRRGSFGTSIREFYDQGTDIVDVGYNETIPYNEEQDRQDFVSDGSTLLVGPLSYVPSQGRRTNWFRSSIPTTYGACDQIEVFAAGRRLRKDPLSVYKEENGSASPEADQLIEAEFSVDGITPYIRITTNLPAGTRITVVKRTGKTWYERGENSASAGITLLENSTPIANFIAQKSTSIPE